jgi:nucleoside 2-deoxyribosyltransferase
MTRLKPHAYLAGPDIFMPDAVEIGRAKKAFLRNLGIVGHYPLDEKPQAPLEDKKECSAALARINEQMMLTCCERGRFGIILADMTPYQGISLDAGTAFEVGFMAALSHRRDILIVGYTNDARPIEERIRQDLYQGVPFAEKDGRLVAPDGITVGAFGNPENLMIVEAVNRTGGKIFTDFEQAAQFAAASANHALQAAH